jgi:hypothetical protein
MGFVSSFIGFRKLIFQYFFALLLFVLYRGLDKWAFVIHHPTGLKYCLLLLVTSLPLVGMVLMVVVTLWKLTRGKDEYQNHLLTQGLIGAIAASFVWIAAGTIMQRIQPILALDPLMIFPMFWCFLAIGIFSFEHKDSSKSIWCCFRRDKTTQTDQHI